MSPKQEREKERKSPTEVIDHWRKGVRGVGVEEGHLHPVGVEGENDSMTFVLDVGLCLCRPDQL